MPCHFALHWLNAFQCLKHQPIGQRFALNVFRVLFDRLAKFLRVRDDANLDAVGEVAVKLFATILDLPIDIAGVALADQLVGKLGGEDDDGGWPLSRRPAFFRLQPDLQILVVELDVLPFDLQDDFAAGGQLIEQFASISSRQRFLNRRHQLADAGADAFEVRLDLIIDIGLSVFGVLDLLDVQLVTQQFVVFFEPRLMRRVGQNDFDLGKRLSDLSFASMRALRPSDAISRSSRIRSESVASMADVSACG